MKENIMSVIGKTSEGAPAGAREYLT
ncbi:MAG: chemotaxis protein CheW, partial [Curvibacter sp.]